MRIVVLSDTHGNFHALEKVIMRNTDADWIFHLGDGERELDIFLYSHPELAQKIIHVAGNCDYNSLSPEYFTLPVMDHKIIATHGHLFSVTHSLDKLKETARELGCDIILYGHTHIRDERFEDGFFILNPGSASCPRDGDVPSFGHVDISEAGVVINTADV
ncbi:MAG: metallophosphoesterase [Ruminococcus sp.]|nr:metallophosphoesterase [Ruminococcus sp.]